LRKKNNEKINLSMILRIRLTYYSITYERMIRDI